MFYIDGVRYYATADFKTWKIYRAFKSAVTVHGWRHESQGIWRGDLVGINGFTIEQWVSQRKLIRTCDLVTATGFSRQHLSKTAADNGIKATAKGRWTQADADRLMRLVGKKINLT